MHSYYNSQNIAEEPHNVLLQGKIPFRRNATQIEVIYRE